MFRQELGQLPIFYGLSKVQLDLIDPMLKLCHFSKDQFIFEQGQPADFVYILLQGEVIIQYKPDDAPLLTVTCVSPGGIFGWSAALGHNIYTSMAYAAKESSTYQFSGIDMHRLCKKYPETGVVLLGRLASVIAERLHSTHAQILNILSEGMNLGSDCEKRKD
jgi:CRP/FNR family transcriptional regulator, cyclic AMP receptor protein